jgi:hypothetical protein
MTLLVYGEGDFSFTSALGRSEDFSAIETLLDEAIDRVVATSLDTREEVESKYPHFRDLVFSDRNCKISIQHGVNAIDEREEDVGTVLWNHPHLGIEDCMQHYQLLCHFFSVHAKRNVRKIIVSLLLGQEERWRILDAAGRAGYGLIKTEPLDPQWFPGYVCKRNLSGSSFKSQHAIENLRSGKPLPSCFYIFQLGAEHKEIVPVPDTALADMKFFACDTCSKSFSSAQGLKTHVRQVHELGKYDGSSDAVCQQCDRRFPDLSSLTKHMKAKHTSTEKSDAKKFKPTPRESEYTCPVCLSTDPSHVARFGSNRVENYSCDTCEKRFREKRALDQHVAQKHSFS